MGSPSSDSTRVEPSGPSDSARTSQNTVPGAPEARDSEHVPDGHPQTPPIEPPFGASPAFSSEPDRPVVDVPSPPGLPSLPVPGTAPPARGEPPAPMPPRDPSDEEDDERVELGDAAARAAPPWLASTVIHLLVLILLGLWVIGGDDAAPVRLEFTALDEAGELDDQPLSLGVEDPQTDDELLTPEDPFEVEDPFAEPPEMKISPDAFLATSSLEAPHIGLHLKGRDPGIKQALVEAFGGNGDSESAVLLGLEWLARQQRNDGSWSLEGPYSDGGPSENTAAATAMAMLAFLGAGHTHQEGKFKENVARGLSYLLGLIDEDGNFFHEGRFTHWLYSQGQCTIALCELYAMTQDSSLRAPAQLAVEFCEQSQSPALGGWRYAPRDGSDMSVTGWVVMAIQSARMAGLEVKSETLRRADEFLDRVSAAGGARYRYQPRRAPTLVMTAEGLLCRQYLGWAQDDERLLRGVDALLDNLPNWQNRNVYYWYYATQVLHHMQGESWTTWNNVMRDLLVTRQVKGGRESGSWHPFAPNEDAWASAGGRLYVTCLSIYILEVYYRHMPLYSSTGVNQSVNGEP